MMRTRDTMSRAGTNGDVAQMGERLTGSQKVAGSIPVVSTKAFICLCMHSGEAA